MPTAQAAFVLLSHPIPAAATPATPDTTSALTVLRDQQRDEGERCCRCWIYPLITMYILIVCQFCAMIIVSNE